MLLQRRVGRLHRLLLAAPERVGAARVHGYVTALLGSAAPERVAACCPDVPRRRTTPVSLATV